MVTKTEKRGESFPLRTKIAAGVLAGLGMFGLAGCGEKQYNYAGEGNGYTVRGLVHDVEDDGTVHIDETQLVVQHASGDAVSWFADKKGHNVFSSNFNFEQYYNVNGDNFWSLCGDTKVFVGHAYDIEDHEITPQQLHAGEVVEIHGEIRDSRAMVGKICESEPYSTYDSITVVPGSLNGS